MGMERLGLGGTLEFNADRANANIKRTDASFAKLTRTSSLLNAPLTAMGRTVTSLRGQFAALGASARTIGGGVNRMAGAMRAATLVTAGMTLAVGASAKKAVDFEKQMSAVGAILGKTPDQMADLTDKAQEMGIVSVFSATQSGQAMEYLARAGFSTNEIMSALEGTMNAAAAEGMDLATASDIVASQVRAFGLEASQASAVADKLALASAKSNTNIVGLGEGLKYVAPIARGMGVSIDDTVASLGLLADSGLKSSLAGTALKNALLKLAKPTGEGAKVLERMGLTVADASGNFVGMNSVLSQLATGMNALGGRVNRTSAAAELFGLRGIGLTNLLSRLDKKTAKGALTFSEFSDMLQKAGGSAKQMAEIRLANLSGRMTLLMSSLEALSIQIFGPILKPMADAVNSFTGGLNKVLFALKALNRMTAEQRRDPRVIAEGYKKFGRTVTDLALGFRDAIDTIKSGLATARRFVTDLAKSLREKVGTDGLRTLTKLGTLFAIAAAAVTPVLVGVGLVAFTLTSVLIPAITGVASIFAGVFSGIIAIITGPLLPIIGLAVAAFFAIRRENESVGQTFMRVWGVIKDFFVGLWNDVLVPFASGFKATFGPMWDEIMAVWWPVFEEIKSAIGEIASIFMEAGSSTNISWREVGGVFASVVQVIMLAMTPLLDIFSFFVKSIRNVVLAFKEMFGGEILRGFARLGSTILDVLLAPIRLVVSQAIRLAKLFDLELPAGIQTFAREGITGLIFPKEPTVAVRAAERQADVVEQVTGARGTLRRAQQEQTAQTLVEATRAAGREMKIDNNITLTMDGREAAVAVARHRTEIQERAGFKATPWQRRMLLEHGAAPVR